MFKKISNLKEEYLDEMARVCFLPSQDKNSIEVYVKTDDGGYIPHFHVRKYGTNNKPEWETCIMFEKNSYFIHGEYKDKLPNKKIASLLDSSLRLENPKDPGRTYFQTAIVAWNNNNLKVELPFDLEQPDYTKLY